MRIGTSVQRFRWLVATLVVGLHCAGRIHMQYHEKLAAEYVYPRSTEQTIASVWQILREQGSLVDRKQNRLVAPGRVVEVIAVDDTHSQIRAYSWKRAGNLTRDVEQRGRLEGSSPNLETEQAISAMQDNPMPELRPGDVTDPIEKRRDPQMEWMLLQKLDSKAAKEIETEETVVSGCALTRLFRSHPKPPEYPKLPKSFCQDDVPGSDALVETHRLVLLGEIHGTKEVPAFTGRLACHACASGQSVVVAVELPRTDQPLVDRFLSSEGSAEDANRLLAGGRAWAHTYFDGRSSKATFELLEKIRVMRHSGMPITALFYDEPDTIGAERDAAMARNLETARREAIDHVFIVITGNVHARTVPGTPWDAQFTPMGLHLQKVGLRPVALNVNFTSGTAWTCQDVNRLDCGIHPIYSKGSVVAFSPTSNPTDPMWRGSGVTSAGAAPPEVAYRKATIRLWDSPSADGYLGEFYVGQLTASPPAYEP